MEVKKCLYPYIENCKKHLQVSVDSRKSRRRKTEVQHHNFIFYKILLFYVAERCVMCIVAVHFDVKEGKDNLRTWLICKYVWCKGQINITSWIYNVADGSWNYFWPSLWLFSKVSAARVLVKLLNGFVIFLALCQCSHLTSELLIPDCMLWVILLPSISKNSRT